MTENEAKAFLKIEKQCINRNCDRNCAKCDIVQKVEDLNSAYDTAIKALEEVQQYRAIGTPEEYQAAMERNNEKTRIIDGVTERCGYDFGTDAFRIEMSKFCPVCGREIERSGEE